MGGAFRYKSTAQIQSIGKREAWKSGRYLAQRRIAHAESRTDVLRNQFDRRSIGDRVALGQVLHGLNQQALSVNVSRIGSALSAFAAELRRNWNGEDLGHEENPISLCARQV